MPGPSVRAGATSLSVALLLLAACSGGGKDDDESVQVIPFAADPVGDPGSSAELAPDDVPDCTQEDLVLRLLSPGQSSTSAAPERPASTGEVRTLAIEADAGVTCGLAGTPVVHLVPEEAAAGPVQADPTPPAAGRLLMSGRQHLVSSLIWPSSCAPEDADVQAQVDVTGATLEVPLPAPPACDPNQPTRAGAWAPLRAPAQLLPLAVSLVDPPTELPYGGTVEVVVEVRNEGVGPFQLDPCPQYRISFGSGASTAAADNHFNCAAAPAELGPDQSLRFAAELALPADQFAHDTEGTLGVELTDDYGAAARTKPLTVSTD
ncbi:MAG TPA: hypothetical protein VH479_11125 [Acidimicrobiales bacterium]